MFFRAPLETHVGILYIKCQVTLKALKNQNKKVKQPFAVKKKVHWA